MILDALHRYALRFPDERSMVDKTLGLLQAAEGDVLSRSTASAHITASCLIRQEASLLTIWHPFLKMWLQPGGHIDPGETVTEAVLREAREETGLDCAFIEDEPFDIDCLWVPANPKKGEGDHYHIDFRYLLEPIAQVGEPELPTCCIGFADLHLFNDSLGRLAPKLMALTAQSRAPVAVL